MPITVTNGTQGGTVKITFATPTGVTTVYDNLPPSPAGAAEVLNNLSAPVGGPTVIDKVSMNSAFVRELVGRLITV